MFSLFQIAFAYHNIPHLYMQLHHQQSSSAEFKTIVFNHTNKMFIRMTRTDVVEKEVLVIDNRQFCWVYQTRYNIIIL